MVSVCEKISIHPTLRFAAPQREKECSKQLKHHFQAQILARITAVTTSIFALFDVLLHLAQGVGKGIYSLLARIHFVKPAKWSNREPLLHFGQAGRSLGIAAVGSLIGLIWPRALHHLLQKPNVPNRNEIAQPATTVPAEDPPTQTTIHPEPEQVVRQEVPSSLQPERVEQPRQSVEREERSTPRNSDRAALGGNGSSRIAFDTGLDGDAFDRLGYNSADFDRAVGLGADAFNPAGLSADAFHPAGLSADAFRNDFPQDTFGNMNPHIGFSHDPFGHMNPHTGAFSMM